MSAPIFDGLRLIWTTKTEIDWDAIGKAIDAADPGPYADPEDVDEWRADLRGALSQVYEAWEFGRGLYTERCDLGPVTLILGDAEGLDGLYDLDDWEHKIMNAGGFYE